MENISIDTGRKGNLSAVTDSEFGSCSLRKKVEGRKILKKKLKNLEKENEELKQLIQQKEQENHELKINVGSLNDMINSVNVENLGKGSSVASTKIMDLSKKNRQLTAELEAMKSKYSKLDSKCTKIEKELCQHMPKIEPKESLKKVACCNSSSKLDTISDQLTTTKQKLFDALNQNTELKSNLKLAQKCIQQEIGESINLVTLASNNTSWRGRSQQIISLQNKVAELKERIENAGLGDEPLKQQIRKFETMKRAEIDELTQKITDLNMTVDDQKKKIVALKTRNKNLCDDAMNYKLKTLNLMEKSGSSDNSIVALQEKINIQKFQYENRILEIRKDMENLEEKRRLGEVEHSQTKIKLKNMDCVVQEKENVISELHDTIKQLEDDLRSVCGDFLFSCRELKKEEFVTILDALECEKDALIELVSSLNQRVEEEREKVSNLTDQLSKQRVKHTRLEAKYKDLQKEQETQQVKKKRSQRVADYARSLTGGISTLIFENSNSNLDSSQSGDSHELQIEDLKNKLEISNERITFLEEKLTLVTNEKTIDSDAFNEIMKISKNVILRSLEENRKSKSTLNITDSLEEFTYPNEEYEPDSIEETNNCSRIFSPTKAN